MKPTLSLRSLTACFGAATLLGLTACSKSEPTAEPAADSSAPASTPAAPAGDAAALPAAPGSFDTIERQVSYGIGRNIGTDLASDDTIAIDLGAIVAGLQDGLSGADTRVSEADLTAAFQVVQQKARDQAMTVVRENRAKAQAFLEQNRERPDVVTTGSGLQYEILEEGDGAKPAPTNTVRVHYHGTLLDGTVFDSSVDRGQPIEFPVTGVIPGWVEALQLMPVGSKWRLFIPPALGYGDQDRGAIPPGSALIFDVELLEIK